MGIVAEDIARVRSATDFVALVGEHVALRRVGARWSGLCPFHAEKSPSLSVNGEEGLYYCFGCGASGDAITFLREMEHLEFAEAVEALASRAGISLRYDDDSSGQDHQRRARVHETLERATAWYHERLLHAPDAAAARGYLRSERGYDGEVVRRYRLGWAPEGWGQLSRALGLPSRALADAGLAYLDGQGRHSDFFRARLLFPIFDASGRPVGAGGRSLPGGRPPKYKNTTNTAVYDKSRVLYGLNWAKKAVVATGRVVICEGYTDVIGLHLAGVPEAVATCGTALADGHVRIITNFARRIVLAYDADAAGQAAAEHYYEWERRFNADIRVATLPAGADPADLARSDPEALRVAIERARPYLEFRLERLFARADLSSVEGRARAASEAMALVSEHPNALVRDQYLMAVADRCRVGPERLRQLAAPGPASERSSGGRSRGEGSRGEGSRGEGSRGGCSRGEGSSGEGSSGEGSRGEGRQVARAETPAPRAGASRQPLLGGPELEALRLAVHRPEEVASRLEAVLFDHAVARAAFQALAGAETLLEAIESADPQVATLLSRVAVEEVAEDADDVMVRLVERAGRRALEELRAEMRQAPAERQAAFASEMAWLKLTLERLRSDGAGANIAGEDISKSLPRETEAGLVAWFIDRYQPAGPLSTDTGEVA